jgi:hypothetical protein
MLKWFLPNLPIFSLQGSHSFPYSGVSTDLDGAGIPLGRPETASSLAIMIDPRSCEFPN